MTVSTRFRPESKQAFSRYAGDLARAFGISLQVAQELLARIYGYADLHELQQTLKGEGTPGPFAQENPAVDAARTERLRELFGSPLQDVPAQASVSFLEALGLFLPSEAHRARIEALAEHFEQDTTEEESEPMPQPMRLALTAPVLYPQGKSLPKKVIGTALPECVRLRGRWEKTASFSALKEDGFALKAVDAVYQRLEKEGPQPAQLIIFLDFLYSGPGNGPTVLHEKLSDPKLQATLSQVIEIFTEVSALKSLRIGPWTLSYRVTHDGRVIDYQDGIPKITQASSVIHPEQFVVNEAWVAFLFVNKPVKAVEGEHWALAILDVMSGYILSQTMVPLAGDSQDKVIAELLSECLRESKQRKPRILFVQKGTVAQRCAQQAALKGVIIETKDEAFLLPAIKDAKATVGERLSQLPG